MAITKDKTESTELVGLRGRAKMIDSQTHWKSQQSNLMNEALRDLIVKSDFGKTDATVSVNMRFHGYFSEKSLINFRHNINVLFRLHGTVSLMIPLPIGPGIQSFSLTFNPME